MGSHEEEPALAAPVEPSASGFRVHAVDGLERVRLLAGLVLNQVVDARAAVRLGREALIGDADVAGGAPHGQGRVRYGPCPGEPFQGRG